MSATVLLVGLDSADRDLVVSWADMGRLPTLQKLRRDGVWGEVTGMPGLGDDAAWSSFSTGLGPGSHGRFYHQRYREGSYDLVRSRRDGMSHAPFWERLADHDRRVAVIDVPKSPLGRIRNGMVIADWMCHGTDGPGVVCKPPVLDDNIARRLVRDPTFVCDRPRDSAADIASYERQLIERAAVRTDVLLRVLEPEPWDLFLAVFAEPHCVGHQCWRSHDRAHPAYQPGHAAFPGDVVEHVYRDVDAQLGRLVEAAGANAIVIVFSLLGMGPNYSGAHLLDEILARLDPHTRSREPFAARALAEIRARTPGWLHRWAPPALRRAARESHARLRTGQRFWAVPTDMPMSAIRINQAGREPHGIVRGGREFELVCAELSRELLALEDPDSGVRLVRDVLVTREVYAGPACENFADVLVIWEQAGPIVAATSPRIGVVRAPPAADRSGNHRANGWFVAARPGISPAVLGRSVSALDFAPTVSGLLGVPLDGAEGNPIAALTPSRHPRQGQNRLLGASGDC
jgi:predicted AlkP superfamily phosphohydrolase/phosphomutase